VLGDLKGASIDSICREITPEYATLFRESNLHFNKSPATNLFIKSSKNEGRNILMIGDGLNDAGALRQSQIGIALNTTILTRSLHMMLFWKRSNFIVTDFLRFGQIS
jgi:Cu+-exporting ATPase